MQRVWWPSTFGEGCGCNSCKPPKQGKLIHYQFFPDQFFPYNSSPTILPKSNSSQEQFFPTQFWEELLLGRIVGEELSGEEFTGKN
jgi:hypothetical protein